MKRYASGAAFEGLAVAVIVTMAVGGLTGMIVRESWLSGQAGTVSATLGGIFVGTWVIAGGAISYVLASGRDRKC